jgi:flagellar FliL protein
MAVAEKAPAAVEAAAAPAKKGPPVIVLIAVTAVVAFAVGFALMKTVFMKHTKTGPAPIVIGETVPLDEFLINLADSDSSHYVKTTIGLGLIQGKTAEEFKTKVPIARDAIVMVLSAKTLSEVSTTDGKEALKKELMDSINKEIGDNSVGAIYFEGFATQ